MLGLVSYEGSSDEEDSKDEQSDLPHISDEGDEDFRLTNSNQVLLKSNVFHLPAPTSHTLKPPLKNKSVKISIPSLDEFDEEDGETNKPRKAKLTASLKGSGLFSVLPKPRHEFLATPRQMCSSTCPLTPQNIKSKAKTTNPSDPDEHHFDEKKEEENFFTIPDRKSDTLEVVADKTIEEYLKPIVQHETKASKCSNHEDIACISHTEIEMPCHASSTPIELNNDVLRKLGGRKRKGEDLIVKDVDGNSLVPDSQQWLTKQLSTETTYRPSHNSKHDGPTSQQKRKHQITYLAFQAKANELDLKNQWANNRQSKRQTQSKYGF
ncbi:hypothetical protein M8J76_006051 [Diaphorina citri]|nr:hypothetical protein M8J76_006051 [Diaphorina citri]